MLSSRTFLHQLADQKLAEANAPMRVLSLRAEGTAGLLVSMTLPLLMEHSNPKYPDWAAGAWVGSSQGALLAAALAVGVPADELFGAIQTRWSNGGLWSRLVDNAPKGEALMTDIPASIKKILGGHRHTQMRDIEKPLILYGVNAKGQAMQFCSGYFGRANSPALTVGDCCLATFVLRDGKDADVDALARLSLQTPGGLARIKMLSVGGDSPMPQDRAPLLLRERYLRVALPSLANFRSTAHSIESLKDFDARTKSLAMTASKRAYEGSKVFLERFFST